MTAVSGLIPIIRGLVLALIGLTIGSALGTAITSITDRPTAEVNMVLGFVFALIGWLLGVGLWDVWGREWFGLQTKPTSSNWKRYFEFCTDHKVIGIQYLVTLVVIFLLAGALAMVIRLELIDSGETVMGAVGFNTTMGLHGIMMVAVAVAAIIGGFGNFLVPIMIGTDDMAFPRVNAFTYWILPPVAVLLIASPFFGGFDAGWTAYPPLSVINADGQMLFNLAFATFGLSSIFGGLNMVVTIIMMRAPGMSWGRLPIFVWSIFAASWIAVTATQVVFFGLLMIILDRAAGMAFFNVAEGGDPLLFEHVFWFYSHPAVYVMILPALGIELEIISHFSRKPVFAYKWVVASFIAIVVLSMVVWAHHLFTSGMQDFLHIPFMVVTELISIPTGAVFLSALGTMWMGKLWLRAPMLFAMGVVFNFLIGGLTGIFLADIATDIQLQDTYFVVAHFHYTMVGGEIFVMMGAIYYWFPKVTGRMYNEGLAKLHFWWMFVTYNATFLAMFWVGVQGMNRRVADYPAEFTDGNVVVSILAFGMGASFIVFAYNLANAWIKGPVAEANPWRARTLEWQTSSPPPVENFVQPPIVTGDPYAYGEPGVTHAQFGGLDPAAAPAGGDGD